MLLTGAFLGTFSALSYGCGEDERIVNVNVPVPTPVPTLPMPASTMPLSSLVAVAINPATAVAGSPTTSLPAYVKSLMARYDAGTLPAGTNFPLTNDSADAVRAIPGTTVSVVAKWLDPLNDDPSPKRFGANTDYTAYFGDGWNSNWTGGTPGASGNAPQWSGSDTAGYIWTNHEYISGTAPSLTAAPTDSCLEFAQFLKDSGVLTNDVTANVWSQADVDIFARNYKRQLGGSWFRVTKQANGAWTIDRSGAAERYDGTSATLASVSGHTLLSTEVDDAGNTLPTGVIPGILGDCSGGTSPWGTIFTAEENVQDYYGDMEPCWTSQQKFVAGVGFDPGANISPPNIPDTTGAFGFGNISSANERKHREGYGWLVEIDPGVPAGKYYTSVNAGGDGAGHRKMGSIGRFRWENVTFVTDGNWRLIDGQPIVMYAGNDRRSGHVYKWVSQNNYTAGMTKGQIRALLDAGNLYVAHFADLNNSGDGTTLIGRTDGGSDTIRGNGQWILLSTTNTTQTPPNATALGTPAITVGAALQDVNYNGIGGFPDDDMVRRATFTAALKLGIREMNRPEDLDWNPKATLTTGAAGSAAVLYIALTNNNRKTALNDAGVLLKGTDHDTLSPLRTDRDGAIMALEETGNPATATAFTFWRVWKGVAGTGAFDASSVDNLMIDKDGGVWFGTDGNYGRSTTSDALYLLNLTPGSANYGRGFRVIAGPSNSEATGPCLSPGMTTLFFGAQHPGEDDVPSTWPQTR